MASLRITGEQELMRALAKAPTLATAALAGQMIVEQEKTMTEAKLETPVDTGTLRASGHVQPPRTGAGGVEVAAGFGGGAEKYAVFVHENLSANHPVGGAKFLERPFLARAPQVTKNLAEAVAKAWLTLRT